MSLQTPSQLSHPPSPPRVTPHTVSISDPPQPPAPNSPPPPPPEEPIHTGMDCQSHEDRILSLTQSALELKRRIASEAERLKKTRSKLPGRVDITVTTATPPPVAPPPSLPGVASVHRQAGLAEEARRQGEAATRIQALFRGYKVRRGMGGASLGRVGDGEEDSVQANGVLNNTTHCSVLKPALGSVLKSHTPSSQSVAVQTLTSTLHQPLHLEPATTTTKVSESLQARAVDSTAT